MVRQLMLANAEVGDPTCYPAILSSRLIGDIHAKMRQDDAAGTLESENKQIKVSPISLKIWRLNDAV